MWCEGLKVAMPQFFYGVKVLEMGSLNVNGTLRDLFVEPEYTGVDVIAGKDVDIVGTFHEIDFADKQFDVVCSVNSLEHDIYFNKTLPKMYALLTPGGLLFISAAYKWVEHGTRKHTPWASGTTKMKSGWADYYKNITPADIMRYFKYDMFKWYMLSVCEQDVQFVGIK
jgi:SAM-dependent methyltransferase